MSKKLRAAKWISYTNRFISKAIPEECVYFSCQHTHMLRLFELLLVFKEIKLCGCPQSCSAFRALSNSRNIIHQDLNLLGQPTLDFQANLARMNGCIQNANKRRNRQTISKMYIYQWHNTQSLHIALHKFNPRNSHLVIYNCFPTAIDNNSNPLLPINNYCS